MASTHRSSSFKEEERRHKSKMKMIPRDCAAFGCMENIGIEKPVQNEQKRVSPEISLRWMPSRAILPTGRASSHDIHRLRKAPGGAEHPCRNLLMSGPATPVHPLLVGSSHVLIVSRRVGDATSRSSHSSRDCDESRCLLILSAIN